MNGVAEWCQLYDDYKEHRAQHPPSGGGNLEVRLYNTLPTVNLFRADSNLFVGPYLLDVEDRSTPTFLVRGDTSDHSVGRELYDAYQTHFEAVWNAPTTRQLKDVSSAERAEWSSGEYAGADQ